MTPNRAAPGTALFAQAVTPTLSLETEHSVVEKMQNFEDCI